MSDSAPVASGAPATTVAAPASTAPVTDATAAPEAPKPPVEAAPKADAATLRTLATMSKQNRELQAKLADFEAKVKAGETIAQTVTEKDAAIAAIQAKYDELEKLAQNPAELVRKRGYAKEMKHWEELAEAYANPDKGGPPPEDPRIGEIAKSLQEMKDAASAKEKAEIEAKEKAKADEQAAFVANARAQALDWATKAMAKEPDRWPLVSNMKDIHQDIAAKVLGEVQDYIRSKKITVDEAEADRLMAQGFDQAEKMYRDEFEPLFKAIAPKPLADVDDLDGGGIRTYMKDSKKLLPKARATIDSSSRSSLPRTETKKPMQGGPSRIGVAKDTQPFRR